MSDIEIVNDIFRYCESAPVSKGIQRLYRRRMRSTLVSAILTAYKDHQYYDRAFLHTLLDGHADTISIPSGAARSRGRLPFSCRLSTSSASSDD